MSIDKIYIEKVTINNVKYLVAKCSNDHHIISVSPDITELEDKINSLESSVSDLEDIIRRLA